MFRVAICDDEKDFLFQEKELISNYMQASGYQCEIELFTSGTQLMEKGSDVGRYDIIFLDVNMENLDGIETAKQIRTYTTKPYIVFLTAFVSYALEGYKVDAIRYLLKDDKMLEKELEECIDTIVSKMNYVENKHTFELLQEYHFCRVHKSYLVNMNYMEEVKRYCAMLSNGDHISIAQSKFNNVRDEFTCYKGDV